MDIANLDKQLQLLQCIGYTLNIDQKYIKSNQRLKLKLAHIQVLQSNADLDELKFWGKIEGIAKNYYIMIGLTYCKNYEFPHKKFFWASQDFVFKELPQLLLQHEGLSQKNNILFSGDPNKIIVNLQGEGGQQPPAQENQENPNQAKQKKSLLQEEDQDLKKVPKKNFTQLHRLSTVVRAIQNDAQCVPKGSYQMNVEHQLHPKTNFYGLNYMNAVDINSWQHFRAPQSEQGRKNIEDDMVVFSSNILDGISIDQPKGLWSIQLDSQLQNATVRNLLWPGYFAFHRLQSNLFGGIYIGDGIKNVQLPFMI